MNNMFKHTDVMDIRREVKKGILKFYIYKNFIMCIDTQSGETIVAGEIEQEVAE